MPKLDVVGAAVVAVSCVGAVGHARPLPATFDASQPIVVFVHGAFADGSSWSRVVSILIADGYQVVAVQNPCTSLADDVAATDRVLRRQTRPVVLVGHGWGGAVITQAGNAPNVAALVYVSAFAPDDGRCVADAAVGFPAPWEASAQRDDAGFVSLSAASVERDYAPDLPSAERALIAAAQVPWFGGCATDRVAHAAWHEKPTWWVIGERDRMIAPELQARTAAEIGAIVTRIPTGHAAMLADPEAVAAAVVAAAERVRDEGRVAASATGAPAAAAAPRLAPPSPEGRTARDLRGPAGVVPLSSEPPARLVVDPPLAGPLALGRVVVQYRAENVRIEPVFGPGALDVSPRVGHVHVTVDDLPWHWLDASGEPLTVTGLLPGPHKILIELVNAVHQTLDYRVLTFEVPTRSLVAPDPNADGFRSAPALTNPK